ncbi:hypothetical protein [Arcobacter ellisii]|uniref:Uncharacterized protein n=1 Tax=Arcobacter ellisii TaxID=913109 RepID=A0A347U4R5_9BACT|nr:hypothetical protein [Arcobacter ellisii]AXX93843.1 hypothetical protein AELL_0138 [Arcobacter ellisii]RXI33038.1 hypothetical protein CP962_01125 [Arcobacter ellisii]
MPQLIAMIIVVVGAMIYMFQTFGGTGDKIEGIAQKSSIITEINNVKNGVQLALRGESIKATDSTVADKAKNLQDIANLEFFPEQINNQLKDPAAGKTNTYQAISFGGKGSNTLEITLVLPSATDAGPNARPGLFIDLSQGSLATNAGFLEKQLKTDLGALGSIDSSAASASYNNTLDAEGDIGTAATGGSDSDGKFIIYFKDLPRGMIDKTKS